MKINHFLTSSIIIAAILAAPEGAIGQKPADNLTSQVKDDGMLHVEDYQAERGENVFALQFPSEGNPKLLDSIRNWMNQTLGGGYSGNLADGKQFFDFYAKDLVYDTELDEYGGFNNEVITLDYQNDRVVTFTETIYVYMGGAHGMGAKLGQTFLKTDGTRFTRDCFTSEKALMPLIISGLKKYFEVKTDKELLQELQLPENDLEKLPFPTFDPYITEAGIVFSYPVYDIAPYSAGQPTLTLSPSEIAPYLNSTGKRFF